MAEEQPDNLVLSLLRAIRADLDEVREMLRVQGHRLNRIEDRFDSVDETRGRLLLLQVVLREHLHFNKRLRAIEEARDP
jgi:acetylornithine/succinyldiaminopimelate/putrescine aminotransferase